MTNEPLEENFTTKHIVFIAGEASGDFLGANLIRSLRQKAEKENIRLIVSGIGGPRMTDEGVLSLFPMHDLSVMGITEVLSALPRILKRLRQTKKYIADSQPDMLITIDAPDFCLRVAKSVKKNYPNIKTVHYVSPTVWAWRAGRAKKISKFLDMVLCLFPMEPAYYTNFDIIPEFVGHPLVQTVPNFTDEQKQGFCDRMKLDFDKPILCVLPGSRRGEIKLISPIFAETVKLLQQKNPDIQVIIPTLSRYTDDVENAFQEVNAKVIVPMDDMDKYLAFSSSTAALHASGTVGLELALCNTPMVTAYKVSWLTGIIGRLLITSKFVNLVNILLEKSVVKERLQDQCTAPILCDDLMDLLVNINSREQQRTVLSEIKQCLTAGEGSKSPAFMAADTVLRLLGSERRCLKPSILEKIVC